MAGIEDRFDRLGAESTGDDGAVLGEVLVRFARIAIAGMLGVVLDSTGLLSCSAESLPFSSAWSDFFVSVDSDGKASVSNSW